MGGITKSSLNYNHALKYDIVFTLICYDKKDNIIDNNAVCCKKATLFLKNKLYKFVNDINEWDSYSGDISKVQKLKKADIAKVKYDKNNGKFTVSISTKLNAKYKDNGLYLEDFINNQNLLISHYNTAAGIPYNTKTTQPYSLRFIDIINIKN